jgi:hypothetical protein
MNRRKCSTNLSIPNCRQPTGVWVSTFWSKYERIVCRKSTSTNRFATSVDPVLPLSSSDTMRRLVNRAHPSAS